MLTAACVGCPCTARDARARMQYHTLPHTSRAGGKRCALISSTAPIPTFIPSNPPHPQPTNQSANEPINRPTDHPTNKYTNSSLQVRHPGGASLSILVAALIVVMVGVYISWVREGGDGSGPAFARKGGRSTEQVR